MPKTNWYFKLKIKKNHNKPDHNLKFHLCVYISIFFEWWTYEASIMTIISISCWALHTVSFLLAIHNLRLWRGFSLQSSNHLFLSLTFGHGNELGCTWVSLSQLSTYDFLWFSFLLWKGFMPFFNVSFFLFAITKGQGIDDGSLGKGNGSPQLLLYCC